MIGSLLALLLAAQPAPAEEPVVTDVEVQADVQAEDETPVAEAEADAAVDAQATVAAAPPEEEIVCRRRLSPSERIGQRHRVVRDCRPRSEWESAGRRRSAND